MLPKGCAQLHGLRGTMARWLSPAREEGLGRDTPTQPLCSRLRTANIHHWSAWIGVRTAPGSSSPTACSRPALGPRDVSPVTLGARQTRGEWVPQCTQPGLPGGSASTLDPAGAGSARSESWLPGKEARSKVFLLKAIPT